MKIIHFAGLHLGIETYGSVDLATGLSTRLLDVLKAERKKIGESIEVGS
jgi:exonuclease SbcD